MVFHIPEGKQSPSFQPKRNPEPPSRQGRGPTGPQGFLSTLQLTMQPGNDKQLDHDWQVQGDICFIVIQVMYIYIYYVYNNIYIYIYVYVCICTYINFVFMCLLYIFII